LDMVPVPVGRVAAEPVLENGTYRAHPSWPRRAGS
jgi:hypothetical protein